MSGIAKMWYLRMEVSSAFNSAAASRKLSDHIVRNAPSHNWLRKHWAKLRQINFELQQEGQQEAS
jgi:hypothetical protein